MNRDINYEFWKMAYDRRAIDTVLLGQAVKCDSNPYGEISSEQYRTICGDDFTSASPR